MPEIKMANVGKRCSDCCDAFKTCMSRGGRGQQSHKHTRSSLWKYFLVFKRNLFVLGRNINLLELKMSNPPQPLFIVVKKTVEPLWEENNGTRR